MNIPTTKNQEDGGLDPSRVQDFLYQHPGFFLEHPDLLTRISIPHPSGEAVSLIERQVSTLREQNSQARKRFRELVSVAEDNQRLIQRLHALSLRLMEAPGPAEIFHTLNETLRRDFNADEVVIRIFAEAAFLDQDSGEEFVGIAGLGPSAEIIAGGQPVCGRLPVKQAALIFGEGAEGIASGVLMPLGRRDWSGLLAIGSHDPNRFRPGMGLDLLSYLGDVASLVIDPWTASLADD